MLYVPYLFTHVKHVLRLAVTEAALGAGQSLLWKLFSFILVRFHSSFLVRIFYIVFVIIPANLPK